MTMSVWMRVAGALMAAGLSVAHAVVPLSNPEAKAALEAEHAAQSVFRLQVGAFAVIGKDGKYSGPDTITERRYNELRAWDHVGIVHIKADPQWVAFEQGKGDAAMYNQKKEGVIRRILVEPTAKAKPYRDRKVANQYNIPMGNLVIDKIEENVARAFGNDEYRVITFSGKIDFLPVTAAYFLQYFAKKIKQEGRAIYLMKYQPATKSWTREAADWADENGSFKSNNVQGKLLQLGR